MKKTQKIILFTIAAIFVAGIIGMLVYNNSTPVKYNRQLDLGNKYLAEQDYEQAKVAYEQAIEIDPMGVEAYAGLADVYVVQGEYEKALNTLQTGIELTGDERLTKKLQELKAQIEEIRKEEIKQSVKEQLEEIEQVARISSGHKGGADPMFGGPALTDMQVKDLCMPYVELLESYREAYPEGSDIDGAVPYWYHLQDLYLGMGELDKCSEVRKQIYEISGVEGWASEVIVKDDISEKKYNKYGQYLYYKQYDINETSIYAYNENGQEIKSECWNYDVAYCGGCSGSACDYSLRTYVYDLQGRIIERRDEGVLTYPDGCTFSCVSVGTIEYSDTGYTKCYETKYYENGVLSETWKRFVDGVVNSKGEVTESEVYGEENSFFDVMRNH